MQSECKFNGSNGQWSPVNGHKLARFKIYDLTGCKLWEFVTRPFTRTAYSVYTEVTKLQRLDSSLYHLASSSTPNSAKQSLP